MSLTPPHHSACDWAHAVNISWNDCLRFYSLIPSSVCLWMNMPINQGDAYVEESWIIVKYMYINRLSWIESARDLVSSQVTVPLPYNYFSSIRDSEWTQPPRVPYGLGFALMVPWSRERSQPPEAWTKWPMAQGVWLSACWEPGSFSCDLGFL